MTPRRVTHATGLAVLLSLGIAATAAAQVDTTRTAPRPARSPVTKDQPMPVSKEQPAPVTKEVPTLPDTAPVRTITTDTARGVIVAPTAPTFVPEPVAMQPPARMMRSAFGGSGFYVGLAAGAGLPSGTMNDLGYDPGPTIALPIGWHPLHQALGFRGTFAFSRVAVDESVNPQAQAAGAKPRIYSATLDAVLRAPLGVTRSDGSGLSFYALGGVGAYQFRGISGSNLSMALSGYLGERKTTKFGLDGGLGAEWGIGAVSAFAEGKWITAFTRDQHATAKQVRWIPIVLGLSVR